MSLSEIHKETGGLIKGLIIAQISGYLASAFGLDNEILKCLLEILCIYIYALPTQQIQNTLATSFAIFTNLNITYAQHYLNFQSNSKPVSFDYAQDDKINSQLPMHTALQQYLNTLNTRFKNGISREHSYRGDLEQLISALAPKVLVTNEPARISCGAPDYIITANDIPVGYIEAKDIGKPLNSKEYKEQFDRYLNSLDNLIITDYLTFQLYVDGKLVDTFAIGEIQGNSIVPLPDKFAYFEAAIKDFCSFHGQTIRSSVKLAEMMAAKAKMLANVIENAVQSDEDTNANSTLKDQMHAFKEILIHDIKPREFADIYAQTIAYGMFAARLHDASLNTFTRQEAAELIPKTNPFLRKLFSYIAGPDIDDRIKWIVDALADIFRATDVAALLKNFGKSTQQNDPIIHFYETFLSEYDPKLRKSRGVWYTPEPVVNFIVRAVDDILKTEFNLPDGLADTSKIKIKVDQQGKKVEKEVHRVQILDPATGTGTFLAEVVKQIHSRFEGQQGIWSKYVEDHLIPRLNGFELLMASYAMAHLKLDMLLTETGYKPKKEQRLRVYLTNSLEEYHKDTGSLFAGWLSNEANEANHIKRDTPVMVVLGNPPYSGISSNNGDWITRLIEDYKYVDGVHFGERKHWLNDDYVKFIRFAQTFIEKNESGVLAYINSHSFLDNPTLRGMRSNLMSVFDKIYVLDLHGNAKRSEVSPDGSVDENVFDIQQGVSINLFIKQKAKKTTKSILLHKDLWGTRNSKYAFLLDNTLTSTNFIQLQPSNPNYYFVPKDISQSSSYEKGIDIRQLFIEYNIGIQTSRDKLAIAFTKHEMLKKLSIFKNQDHSDNYIRTMFFPGKTEGKYLPGDTRGWYMTEARKKLRIIDIERHVILCGYRPFDKLFIIYSDVMIDWPRAKFMKNFIDTQKNLGLLIPRQLAGNEYHHVFVCDSIVEMCVISNKTKEQNQLFPLYLYPDNTQLNLDGHTGRVPNLNMDMVGQIAKGLGLEFVSEKEDKSPHLASPKRRGTEKSSAFLGEAQKPPLPQGEGWGEGHNTFAPIDLLDYIYAVLHSPAYREKYKEFLKIDFPRVPYPKDAAKFWKLVALGSQLRQIHLLESPTVGKYITKYPEDGSNLVEKPRYEGTEKGKVYINDSQYFDGVPLVAWEFYIGGYQPAQKWLKDRKGRELAFEDILHYQKIIVALTETDRLMKEVDVVGVE